MGSYGVKLPHLAAWRTYACLSQGELARRVGRSKGTMSDLEHERFGARIGTLHALAQVFTQVLGVRIEPRTLIDCPPPPVAPPPGLPEQHVPDEREALRALEDYLFARIMQRVREELRS